jgi:hypothetical protein
MPSHDQPFIIISTIYHLLILTNDIVTCNNNWSAPQDRTHLTPTKHMKSQQKSTHTHTHAHTHTQSCHTRTYTHTHTHTHAHTRTYTRTHTHTHTDPPENNPRRRSQNIWRGGRCGVQQQPWMSSASKQASKQTQSQSSLCCFPKCRSSEWLLLLLFTTTANQPRGTTLSISKIFPEHIYLLYTRMLKYKSSFTADEKTERKMNTYEQWLTTLQTTIPPTATSAILDQSLSPHTGTRL